jgi:hypothetical protein
MRKIFAPPNTSVSSPRFTIDPPQIHHQKTTFCTPFFLKTPAKMPLYHAKKNNPKKSTAPPSTMAQ